MFLINIISVILLALPAAKTQNPSGVEDMKYLVARWCVTSQQELEKCTKLKSMIKKVKMTTDNLPAFECIRGIDTFDCMEKIDQESADLITLDSGLGYFAGRHYNLLPIMAESYHHDKAMPLTFNAVAVVKKSNTRIDLDNLNGSSSCHPGIGDSAGWVYPMGRLMLDRHIEVKECNSVVKAVSDYFNKGMCLPGAINSFFNDFGNNPVSACKNCKGVGDDWCSSGDRYAGHEGAFRCLHDDVGDIAFIRHDTVDMMHSKNFDADKITTNRDDYELLCPDGTRRQIDDHANCNWGSPKSQIVMTGGSKLPPEIALYKELLKRISYWFSENGPHYQEFDIFDSVNRFKRSNLLFNDATKTLVDVGSQDSYHTWVDETFLDNFENIKRCPLSMIRWCVISQEEKRKCEDMLMAFKAKELKPELDCILGMNTDHCMKMIRMDSADVMTLDAADVYYGGRIYGLVPIAVEDYGDMSGHFSVVAITRKTEAYLTLFNLKGRRTCHGGVRTADGFVIPAHTLIETTQIRPHQCSLYQNMGELFSRSCIPGVLETEYNAKHTPVNLCESCSGGAERKCQRNSNELYYKSTGAFRCLVENGGDVAFARHLTVQDNTDGKNQAIWARNRRSDDYELMCKDGSRRPVSDWRRCSLGTVPGNAIVTAEHKRQSERDIYWNVINYAQMYFSSDTEDDFAMFDSGIVYSDLLFSDACVRLLPVPKAEQNYKTFLGVEFEYSVKSLIEYTCDLDEDTIEYYKYSHAPAVFNSITSLLVLVVTALLFL